MSTSTAGSAGLSLPQLQLQRPSTAHGFAATAALQMGSAAGPGAAAGGGFPGFRTPAAMPVGGGDEMGEGSDLELSD